HRRSRSADRRPHQRAGAQAPARAARHVDRRDTRYPRRLPRRHARQPAPRWRNHFRWIARRNDRAWRSVHPILPELIMAGSNVRKGRIEARQLSVVALAIAALLMLGYGGYRVGKVFDVFSSRYEIQTLVPSVLGLREGAPVTL